MLQENCQDAVAEQTLSPVESERLTRQTTTLSNEARVDLSAQGFWTSGQRSYFGIRSFEPKAPCHRGLANAAARKRNKKEKKLECIQK